MGKETTNRKRRTWASIGRELGVAYRRPPIWGASLMEKIAGKRLPPIWGEPDKFITFRVPVEWCEEAESK